MAVPSDRDYFFQTEASAEENTRRLAKSNNKLGNPIRLKSKILAIVRHPELEHIYVAEATGRVREIEVKSGDTKHTFSDATAPVTCLAVSPTRPYLLFAGCWDKSIYCWDASSHELKRRYQRHEDFIKCVLCTRIGPIDVLISAGADSAIIVWDMRLGQRLYTLRGHARGVTTMATDPYNDVPEEQDDDGSEQFTSVVLFSGDSNREIRRWLLKPSEGKELGQSTSTAAEGAGVAMFGGATRLISQGTGAITAHETSIYALKFDDSGDLWTASADKTVKRLVRENGWHADTSLEHPDFVRDVAVFEVQGRVFTACRDEQIRSWDIASGDLLHVFSGHFDDVTGLLLWDRTTLLSVSLDGTIRRWDPSSPKAEDAGDQNDLSGKSKDADPKKAAALTEEEERELAELMEGSN